MYTLFDSRGNAYKVFSIHNSNGFFMDVCEFGASILKFSYPDNTDIVVGAKHAIDDAWPHYGSICGRVAGRISNARITLNNQTYELEKNQHEAHHRHGGFKGFSKVRWSGSIIEHENGQAVEMKYTSKDGEAGYPGTVHITARYTLNDANELMLVTKAEAESTTVVNLTNHVYWNLHGTNNDTAKKQHATTDTQIIQAPSILDHQLYINASHYYEADPVETLPTGRVLPVANTALDFSNVKSVGTHIDDALCAPYKGYDHVFALHHNNNAPLSNRNLQLAATLTNNSRAMEVWTSCPAIVLYTGNGLASPHKAICLETQFPADCPNIEQFPSITIDPAHLWEQTTVWRFS